MVERKPPQGRKHYRPFLQVVAKTLASSAEIVMKDRNGILTPASVDDVMQRWCAELFRIGQGDIEAFGLEHAADAARGPGAGRAYVLMTNHQSLMDVPSVVKTFPGRLRMVGKRELGDLPVWGHAMKAAGVVFVDRGNRAQSIKALDRAKAQLLEGTSIWIAPEGTRSKDGELGPLKKGGFHLAKQLGAPILPAWIKGTREIISPDGFGVRLHGHITVRYGAAIETKGDDDVPALMDRVRQSLLALQAASAC
jgi:1-acyl-sn-glycerol-3-phosphate acyltransferase